MPRGQNCSALGPAHDVALQKHDPAASSYSFDSQHWYGLLSAEAAVNYFAEVLWEGSGLRSQSTEPAASYCIHPAGRLFATARVLAGLSSSSVMSSACRWDSSFASAAAHPKDRRPLSRTSCSCWFLQCHRWYSISSVRSAISACSSRMFQGEWVKHAQIAALGRRIARNRSWLFGSWIPAETGTGCSMGPGRQGRHPLPPELPTNSSRLSYSSATSWPAPAPCTAKRPQRFSAGSRTTSRWWPLAWVQKRSTSSLRALTWLRIHGNLEPSAMGPPSAGMVAVAAADNCRSRTYPRRHQAASAPRPRCSSAAVGTLWGLPSGLFCGFSLYYSAESRSARSWPSGTWRWNHHPN